jgi:lipopolysaccharide export system permease protein
MIQAVSSITPSEMSSRDVRIEIISRQAVIDGRVNERQNRMMVNALALEESLRKGQRDAAWNRRTNNLSNFVRDVQAIDSIRSDRGLLQHIIEYYRKFALPAGAFSFMFLTVPLGLMVKKNGQAVGFVFGLVISFIYWFMLIGGQTMGLRLGYPPFWSMWLPNITAITVGIILTLLRVRK